MALLQTDFNIFTETIASVFFGWTAGESARDYARLLRESLSHAEAMAVFQTFAGIDVTPLLPSITARTLVIHHSGASMVPMEVARDLATQIPDASLALVKGEHLAGDLTDPGILARIDAFLLGQEYAARPETSPAPAGTATILFADIADSTRLTEELGDAAFREQARALEIGLREAIRLARGSVVDGKLLGDGVMASFTSARDAIEGAVRCMDAARRTPLQLHIGVHAGDVIHEDANVYGGAVNIAARVAAEAAAGEILVSDVVHALARTSANVEFEDRGELRLKGIRDPQRLWLVDHRKTA
jgi:class 3 adenylate cyclase